MHYIKDIYKKRLDLYFDEIPTEEVRTFLKSDGWHWNPTKRCWFTYLSQGTIETATALGASPLGVAPEVSLQRTSQRSVQLTSTRPILNRLYSEPNSFKDIRMHAVSTDELKACGLSVDYIFEYLMLIYCLYKDIIDHSSGPRAIISFRWLMLADFCKKHKLIHESFDTGISTEHIIGEDNDSFESFRLRIERLLTGTEPAVQFIKCAYGVDTVCFEWWNQAWDPTMCQLGHYSTATSEFSLLNYNELLYLLAQILQDSACKKYQAYFSEIINAEYWIQIILWNLEDQNTQDSIDDHTLYIHKGRIQCQTHHKVLQATATLLNTVGANILLNVNYCTQCKKFFMSYSVYQHYRSKYGILLGDLKLLKRDDFTACEDCLAEESPLHLCGYSVAEKNGLSASERQQIIAYVITRGIMDKAQVISHLSWLIDTNKTRDIMKYAVKKWDEDLSYALQFNMDKQDQFILNTLKKYHPNQFKIIAGR